MANIVLYLYNPHSIISILKHRPSVKTDADADAQCSQGLRAQSYVVKDFMTFIYTNELGVKDTLQHLSYHFILHEVFRNQINNFKISIFIWHD